MRNIKLSWSIESVENGFLVSSEEIDNKKFYEKLEDAKKHLKKQIDDDCREEFEEFEESKD